MKREGQRLAPLLSTKIRNPPIRSRVVSRPRLINKLNAGLEGRLTLVSAPAGFGKTTLLSAWSSHHQVPVAWVSLDEGDNDPARFWAYASSALQTVCHDLGVEALDLLYSPQPRPIKILLTNLINEISALSGSGEQLGCKFVLLLDDFHLIDEQKIHRDLTFLLDNLPPNLHLILSTRHDPPLPLARWRVRDELAEIGIDDLQFTRAEATDFFAQVMDLNLTIEQVAALEARTEGWIAGLQLAALSIRNLGQNSDIASFVQIFAGSNRFVMDYLVEEVLARQPAYLQEFLLQTSILDRLSGPLCDAICSPEVGIAGQASGQEILERIEQANLFLRPLDQNRRWYRYHALFASLLRERLARQLDKSGIRALHLRASEWHEVNGLPDEAIGHALKANDHERAADLVEQNANTALWELGHFATVLKWVTALPEDEITRRPRLGIFYALGLLATGQLDASEQRLQAVERGLPPGRSDLVMPIAILRALGTAFRGDPLATIEHSEQALALVRPDDWEHLGFLLSILGDAYHASGDPVAARQTLAQAERASQAAGRTHISLSALGVLSQIEVTQGRLDQAAERVRQAQHLAPDPAGQPSPVMALAYLSMGQILYQRNELEAAAPYLEQSVSLCRQFEGGGTIFHLQDALLYLACLKQAQGDIAGALETIEQGMNLVWEPGGRPDLDLLAACQARLWLAQGDLAAASRWAEDYEPQVRAMAQALSPPVHGYEFGPLTLARVLLTQKEWPAAQELLVALCRVAEDTARTGVAIEALAWLSLAQAGEGQTEQALATLERALILAEPEGYIRVFVDAGPDLGKLLATISRRLPAPQRDYVARLLASFATEPQAEPPAPAPDDLLTERELEVLRLIAAGFSNPEIGQELIVAPGTVKRHTHNLYTKLNVRNRTEAVVRAQELGLL